MKTLALFCLLVTFAIAPASRASIICVAPTSTTVGSFQITAPISFPITASGQAAYLVLQGWVTNDGSQTNSGLSPNLAFSLNGTTSSQFASFYDNYSTTFMSLTPRDGFLLLNPYVAVTTGNTLTLLAGTYTLSATSGFNPQCTQAFTGNLFVADNNSVRISPNVSAVPEPGTWAFITAGAGSLGIIILRHRRDAEA